MARRDQADGGLDNSSILMPNEAQTAQAGAPSQKSKRPGHGQRRTQTGDDQAHTPFPIPRAVQNTRATTLHTSSGSDRSAAVSSRNRIVEPEWAVPDHCRVRGTARLPDHKAELAAQRQIAYDWSGVSGLTRSGCAGWTSRPRSRRPRPPVPARGGGPCAQRL